jgi:ParB family chromosome partitioning protein
MPPTQDLQDLPVALIEPNLSQPRRYFDEAGLEALAGSISECGLLQPVVVRPRGDGKYELIVGERRWRAAKIAGLQTIPALVSVCDDAAALEAALIENMVREDLNPVEEARACATLVSDLGMTQREVARRVGRSRAAVSNILRLMDLSAEILELIEGGQLSRTHGIALLMAKDPQVRRRLAYAAIEQGWTVKLLEDRALASNMDEAKARESTEEQGPDSAQMQDMAALNLARVWGDALGAEVQIRTLTGRKLRVELLFDSLEGAFAVGGRIGEAIAEAEKRK